MHSRAAFRSRGCGTNETRTKTNSGSLPGLLLEEDTSMAIIIGLTALGVIAVLGAFFYFANGTRRTDRSVQVRAAREQKAQPGSRPTGIN